jgi:cardiolipin synthase
LVRELAGQAFERASGAPLVLGNSVRLLRDASENYPRWLEVIASAQRTIHFENYIVYDDPTGRRFADALIERARHGVQVRLIYDWLGCLGKASQHYWRRLREAGVDVRCFNPPRLDSPFGWLSRDHRKMISVDGETAFVMGLCVGAIWEGNLQKGLDPWRDTGVEVQGPIVADIERAFEQTWEMIGEPFPKQGNAIPRPLQPTGEVAMRIVASVPNTAGMLRIDQLVAALAQERLWLTDAYYSGTASYVQALRAAAKDGVDVRLLLPGANDVPITTPFIRAGYRPLLEAGVRIFEWNGPMLHAKTGVADRRWARVGSTNLNITSWLGNCELDAIIEDEGFAREVEQMFLEDLERTTEIVLDDRRRPRPPGGQRVPRRRRGSGGSAGRAAAGAMRIGNVVTAAVGDQRVLGPVEAKIMALSGLLLLALGVLFWFFPKAIAYPLVVLLLWLAASLIFRGVQLFFERRRRGTALPENSDQ